MSTSDYSTVTIGTQHEIVDGRAQAFTTTTLARHRAGFADGAEYVDIAKGTSGLLSNVTPSNLIARSAQAALAELEKACADARTLLGQQGLF